MANAVVNGGAGGQARLTGIIKEGTNYFLHFVAEVLLRQVPCVLRRTDKRLAIGMD